MEPRDPAEVTALLKDLESGESKDAEARLWEIVYDELRAAAARLVRDERPSATLQPTALVDEAYLRLFGADASPSWESRRHFFGAAHRAMRQLLIDRGRKLARNRENVGWQVTLESGTDGSAPDRVADPVLLAESLDALEAHDARAAQVVMLRFFAGLSHEEIGRAMDLSVPTVKRDWAYGRAWLYGELSRDA